MQPLQGEVHGSIIKLTEDPGLPDGQRVEVSVHVVPVQDSEKKPVASPSTDAKPGDGLRRAAGALIDWSEEDDRILEEIAQSRRQPTHRFGPEPDADE